MKFSIIAVVAALASFTSATTVTVYACASSGVASPTVASTGSVIAPTATHSPISYATGAASVNKISGSALGLIVAGGVALLL